jgi:hypothetical protein
MTAAIAKARVFSAETCVFDLLWKASESDQAAISFLKWIDETAKEALTVTTGNANGQIRHLINKMILSFGEAQSQYKNHLAELAAAVKMIKERKLELSAVEKLLPNGKRMDFEITSNGKPVLVEVYNIDFAAEKLHNSDDLKTFLERRIVSKIMDKFAGLDTAAFDWMIVPVLWGNIKELGKYIEAFEYFKQGNILAPFMMIAEYIGPGKDRLYDFGAVEYFLKKQEEIRRPRRR